MSGRTLRTADVMQRLLDDFAADLHTACPGKVESYDPATQTAVVKPMIKRVSREGLDQERVADDLPSLPAVPVAWPRGGGYFMTFPLAAGDSGLLVFSQRPMGSWRDSGQVSDPGDEGTHGLSGVFYPGVETVARKLSNGDAGTGHAVLGKEGGTQIHITTAGVLIGSGSAAHPIPKGDSLLTWLSTHTHPVAGAVAGVSALPTTGINSTKHMVDA